MKSLQQKSFIYAFIKTKIDSCRPNTVSAETDA